MKTRFKRLPANNSTIGHVLATLAIVKKHEVRLLRPITHVSHLQSASNITLGNILV